MKRFGDGTVTETLVKAAEMADQAEHVIVFLDCGASYRLLTDKDILLSELMLDIKLAEHHVLKVA